MSSHVVEMRVTVNPRSVLATKVRGFQSGWKATCGVPAGEDVTRHGHMSGNRGSE
jgi:hypothetical protein